MLNGAPERLLDTYEAERRPHVTSMQKLAVRWGGVIQTNNPGVGRIRDTAFELLDRSGALHWIQQRVKPLPTFRAGLFATVPARLPFRRAVGSLFPQPTVDGQRIDDLLGPGWSAVVASDVPSEPLRRAGLNVVEVGASEWLAPQRAQWAILRPDRYVFACGRQAELAHALRALRTMIGSGLHCGAREMVAA